MVSVVFPKSMIQCQHFAGGEFFLPRNTNRQLSVISPYSGAEIGRAPIADKTTVDEVVSRGQAAFAEWRTTPIKERCQYLFGFRQLVLDDIDAIANIAALESGKTPVEARAGVLKGIEVLEFALSLANLDQGGAMEVSRGVTCRFRREPLGVVAGVTPFNFPAMVPLWMYPIAIALGNCFILKPSEKVPLTSHLMAEKMSKAGLPKGVFSVVYGDKETVGHLIENPHLKAMAFVGSTPVAKTIYRACTSLGKRVLALGGAKNPIIVTPDADPEITIKGVVDSFTGCAGQRCMAASLMIAIGDVDPMIDKIVAQAQKLVLGSSMGALIDRSAKERIESTIDRALEDGFTLRLDGRNAQPPEGLHGGNWLGPTIIDNAKPDSQCARSEIFGPVLTIIRTRDIKSAMAIENALPFGNATSVFTQNGAVADFVAENATSGMIGVNIGVPVPREPFSFGGTKESKFGQGDITGESSLDFWSDVKKITTKWTLQNDQNWMS